MTDVTELTRPIIGIENRTAQEAFDIMCDRITRALDPSLAGSGDVTDDDLAVFGRVATDVGIEWRTYGQLETLYRAALRPVSNGGQG